MNTDGETVHFDQSLKRRQQKSREVSSRFLSPSTTTPAENFLLPSINHALSPPLLHKPRSSTDTRKHRSHEVGGGLIRGLWPSTSSSSDKKLGPLADHIGNERLNDFIVTRKINENTENFSSLNRQRSCSEFSPSENNDKNAKISKENHQKPFFGGSMRYTGKLRFSKKSSSRTASYDSPADDIALGRLSVDETALRRRSFVGDSESDSSDIYSNSSSISSRKSGIEISSKYLHDLPTKPRRLIPDAKNSNSISFESSPKKKSAIHNALKRANSLTTAYGSATSKWALSPGRSGSPPLTVENKGSIPMSFSSLKPPSSPSKAKGVGNLLSMGLDLLRGKKSNGVCLSPLGPGMIESVHQLRLGHNRLVQWRYANARADSVDGNITKQTESNLICAWSTQTKLKHSVLQKKIQLEKEKLEMKLHFILRSHLKSLEAWGDLERQHVSAISMTNDCLHSVICRVPLVEGAKMEPHSSSIALRRASDLATSIKSMLYTFTPMVEETGLIFSELAEVVTQEKVLLEEFSELLEFVSTLEVQERSLKCSSVQMSLLQQQQSQEIAA